MNSSEKASVAYGVRLMYMRTDRVRLGDVEAEKLNEITSLLSLKKMAT